MIHSSCPVHAVEAVGPNIYVLRFHSAEIASGIKPGQFVNIKVNEFYQPLFRRPFSVYRVHDDIIEILFNVVGPGTGVLSNKKAGDILDVIGPLGRSFTVEDDRASALLVAGGLGVAPFPVLTHSLLKRKKKIFTFLGARTCRQLIPAYLENVQSATDDGSTEFRGTVVDLVRESLKKNRYDRPRIYACGPNPMLARISQLAEENDIPCEMSLESSMACGIGLCQGCPVETRSGEKKYALICCAGPVFDSRTVNLK